MWLFNTNKIHVLMINWRNALAKIYKQMDMNYSVYFTRFKQMYILVILNPKSIPIQNRGPYWNLCIFELLLKLTTKLSFDLSKVGDRIRNMSIEVLVRLCDLETRQVSDPVHFPTPSLYPFHCFLFHTSICSSFFPFHFNQLTFYFTFELFPVNIEIYLLINCQKKKKKNPLDKLWLIKSQVITVNAVE